MDDPYLIVRQLLYAVDNTPSVTPTLKRCSQVQAARDWCRAMEEGSGETVIPELVRRESISHCPDCGWEVLEVSLIKTVQTQWSNKAKEQSMMLVCMHPIIPQKNVVYTYTVDVAFIAGVAIHKSNNRGAWVLHSVLCGQPRPEGDVQLQNVYDASMRDLEREGEALSKDLQDLIDIENMLK